MNVTRLKLFNIPSSCVPEYCRSNFSKVFNLSTGIRESSNIWMIFFKRENNGVSCKFGVVTETEIERNLIANSDNNCLKQSSRINGCIHVTTTSCFRFLEDL